jgi:hypothetical protein
MKKKNVDYFLVVDDSFFLLLHNIIFLFCFFLAYLHFFYTPKFYRCFFFRTKLIQYVENKISSNIKVIFFVVNCNYGIFFSSLRNILFNIRMDTLIKIKILGTTFYKLNFIIRKC